jgi:hypothetical protein
MKELSASGIETTSNRDILQVWGFFVMEAECLNTFSMNNIELFPFEHVKP